MTSAGPERVRRAWGVAALAVAVAAVCLLAAWRPWAGSAPVSAESAGDAALGTADVRPLSIPEDARVLVFGDSWTWGQSAVDRTRGYAYVLGRERGWNVTVDGVRGSGYLRPGIDGGTFGERIAALDPALDPDLVILQGSINDRREDLRGLGAAVQSAWDALSDLYPDASVVVFGPAPHVLPVEQPVSRIDRELAELAALRGWNYLSPIAEQWITDRNYRRVIDADDLHPSTAGHAYLALRLARDLTALSAAGTVEE